MQIVSESPARTHTTPIATMFGLAAPSQGSSHLSTWRVRMESPQSPPPHSIDRDQVWMPTSGAFSFTVDGETSVIRPGQALLVPAGSSRHFHAVEDGTEALVCMSPGGRATMLSTGVVYDLPWTE
jgi:quercetin dioxygenase-like cupin family protein